MHRRVMLKILPVTLYDKLKTHLKEPKLGMNGKTKLLMLPKMARNINWKICLIIGITSFALLINNGCNRDYAVRAKWL